MEWAFLELLKAVFKNNCFWVWAFFCTLSKPIIGTATAHTNFDPQTVLLDLIYSCYFCPRPPTLFNSHHHLYKLVFLGSRDALIHFSNTLVLFVEGVSPVRIFASAALILLSPGHAVLLWVSPVLIFFPPHELTVLMLCRSAALHPLCCAVLWGKAWMFECLQAAELVCMVQMRMRRGLNEGMCWELL